MNFFMLTINRVSSSYWRFATSSLQFKITGQPHSLSDSSIGGFAKPRSFLNASVILKTPPMNPEKLNKCLYMIIELNNNK